MAYIGLVLLGCLLLISKPPLVSANQDGDKSSSDASLIDYPGLRRLLEQLNLTNLTKTFGSILEPRGDLRLRVNTLISSISIDGPFPGLDFPGVNQYTSVFLPTISSVDSRLGDDDDSDNVAVIEQIFQEIYSQIFEDAILSERCVQSLANYIAGIMVDEPFSKKMVGSFGRLPDSNFEYTGLKKDFGNSWQCLQMIKTNGTPSFNSQYCLLEATYQLPLNFQIGTCFPDRCDDAELTLFANRMLALMGVVTKDEMRPLRFQCLQEADWKAPDIFIGVVLSTLVALVVIGSLYDVCIHQSPKITASADNNNVLDEISTSMLPSDAKDLSDLRTDARKTSYEVLPPQTTDEEGTRGECLSAPSELGLGAEVSTTPTESASGAKKSTYHFLSGQPGRVDSFLMSFSAVTNCRKIMSAKKTPSTMSVLNGIRVFSMMWIILAHSVSFVLRRVDKLGNPLEITGYQMVKFASLAISNATVSVDTFFVLSGFLVTFLTLKELTKNDGKLNWGLFFFHRWWRLTPVLMVAMGIWATLVVHAGVGILKTTFFEENIRPKCEKTWWTYPLYINNFYPLDSLSGSCMGWAWYLACDVQFFIVSPIFIFLLHKRHRLGIAAVVVAIAISVASLAGIVVKYGFNFSPTQGNFHAKYNHSHLIDHYYTKPYTRIHTYLVGVLLGYAVHANKDRKIKIPRRVAILCWIVALGILYAVIYGTWADGDRRYVHQFEAVIYLALNRLAWAVGVAWIIFACVHGYGGPLEVILGWKVWIPLARLTFCAYLVHPIVIFNYLLTEPNLVYINYWTLTYFFLGNAVLSYAAALVLSLLVEGPIMQLEKMMLGKKKR